MTLICEIDTDVLKTHVRAKMKFLGQGFQKLEHEQDRQPQRQTDAQREATERITAAAFAGGKMQRRR